MKSNVVADALLKLNPLCHVTLALPAVLQVL